MDRQFRLGITGSLLFILGFASASISSSNADEILFRDWTRQSSVTVANVNELGVELADGAIVPWDQVESGKVRADLQESFDRYVSEVGLPLFRMRSRLKSRSHQQLGPLLESLPSNYQPTSGTCGIIVAAATFYERIQAGQRIEAVIPYLIILNALDNRFENRELGQLATELGIRIDPDTGICPDLLPIWFDESEAANVLEQIRDLPGPEGESRYPARDIYIATLAASAGDFDEARTRLDETEPKTQEILELIEISRWQIMLLSEPGRSQAEFNTKLDNLLTRNRAIALYWLGAARLRDAQSRTVLDPAQVEDALLMVLRLPAEYGQYPELAAAGLFLAHTGLTLLGDQEGVRTIERELRTQFPASFLAQKLLDEHPK